MDNQLGISIISKTIQDYFKDTYKLESSGNLLSVGNDSRGVYLIFDSTIFHPQGGGQPSDIGSVCNSIEINFVASFDGIIRHYVTSDNNENSFDSLIGKSVALKVDGDIRITNAKAHTAGHLVGNIVERLLPNLVKKKGYHFPEGPNIEYFGKEIGMPRNELVSKIEEIAKETIKTGAKVSITEENGTRFIQIDGFERIPCGGTHLRNINELKEIKIRKIVVSNGDLRVCYNCS